MKKQLRPLIVGLTFLWMAFVLFSYLKTNSYFFEALDSWKFMLFHIVLMAANGAALFFWGQKKERISLLKVGVLALTTLVVITSFQSLSSDFALVTENIVRENNFIEVRPDESLTGTESFIFEKNEVIQSAKFAKENLPEGVHKYIVSRSYFASLGSVLAKCGISLAIALSFFVLFTSLGWTAFWQKEKELKSTDLVLAFFSGAALLAFPLSVLLAAKQFQWWSVAALLAMAILLSIRKIYLLIKQLLKSDLSLKKMPYVTAAGMGFFIVYFVMLLMDLLRPFPLAWDDSVLYMRGAKLMAEMGFYPSGVGGQAWMTLQSLPWFIWDNAAGSHALLWMVVLMLMLLCFLLAKKILKHQWALMCTGFIALLPSLLFFSIIDLKVELPLLGVLLASLLSFLEWQEQKKKIYLYIFALLLAFALSIKLSALLPALVMGLILLLHSTKSKWLTGGLFLLATSFFGINGQLATLENAAINTKLFSLVAALIGVASIVYSILKEHSPKELLKVNWKPLLLLIGLCIISFSPWMYLHIVDFPASSTANIWSYSNLVFGTKLNPTLLPELAPYCTGEQLSIVADYGRYSGIGQGWLQVLILPWTSTLTPYLITFISDLGFIFLGLLPLWILFGAALFKGQARGWWTGTLLLYGFWWIMAQGVSWYAIPIYVLLSILTFLTLQESKKPEKILLAIFLILQMLLGFLLRNNYFLEQRSFAYSMGLYTQGQATDALLPGYLDLADVIDKYQENGDRARLYKVGTQSIFFFDLSDTQLFEDDMLDAYSCIQNAADQGHKDPYQIIEEMGITHVLLHRGAQLSSSDEINAQYLETRTRLEDTLKYAEDWEIVYWGHGLVLMEVQ